MIAAVILAAGASRRMGKKNKLLMPINGESILKCTIRSLKKAKVDKIVAVLGHEAKIVEEHLSDTGVDTVENVNFEDGMCTSFQTGVSFLKGHKLEGLLLCLGDQPFISENSITHLIETYKADNTGTKVFVLSHKGKKGHPLVFHPETVNDILAIPITGSIRDVVYKYQTEYSKVETDSGVLKDIDTKEDYYRYTEAL